MAAFVLDHGGFAGVPKTLPVQAYIPVVAPGQDWRQSAGQLVKSILLKGSLQEFAPHFTNAEDYSSSAFTADQVHKVRLGRGWVLLFVEICSCLFSSPPPANSPKVKRFLCHVRVLLSIQPTILLLKQCICLLLQQRAVCICA